MISPVYYFLFHSSFYYQCYYYYGHKQGLWGILIQSSKHQCLHIRFQLCKNIYLKFKMYTGFFSIFKLFKVKGEVKYGFLQNKWTFVIKTNSVFKTSLPCREVFYYWRFLRGSVALWLGGFLLYLNFNQSSGSF